MKHIPANRAFVFFVLSFLLCVVTGCGTTTKTFSTDQQTSAEILRESQGRITRIMLNDSTSEFGTQVTINPSTTEWKAANIERREFNEINAFRTSDAWKFTEGNAMHTAITTSMIKSITIPGDRVTTGIIIGSLGGIAAGVGLTALIASGAPSSSFNSASSTLGILYILDVILFGIVGASLGAQAGATHQTMYVR